MSHEEKVEASLAAIEGSVTHLHTIGIWLVIGLIGSYAAVLAIAFKVVK